MKRTSRKTARQPDNREGGIRRARPRAVVSDQADWIQQQQNGLFRYLRLLGADAHEAEDIMQDAFVALLRRYGGESSQAKVRLLFVIARNRLIASRRGRKHRQLVEWSDAVDAWLQEQNPLVLADAHSEQVAACLGELTERARRCLTLRHVEGLAVDRVAAQLQLQRSGALTLLQRSRDLLRACLKRKGVAPTHSPVCSNPNTACPSLSVEAGASSQMQPNYKR